jgi:hypothetical protein
MYEIKNQEGDVLYSNNLSEFCRENNLKNVAALFITYHSKKHHSYKGFSLLKIIDL